MGDMITTCYDEGVALSRFTMAQRKVVSELLRDTACGLRTSELGRPCGTCDRYALERGDCLNGTYPPTRVFRAGCHNTAAPSFLLILVAFSVAKFAASVSSALFDETLQPH